jgi:hypothetical protein
MKCAISYSLRTRIRQLLTEPPNWGIYDLATGEQTAIVDLTASIPNKPSDSGYFASDVAVSLTGVAYVTDSRMKIVYKVNRYHQASVLLGFYI